MDNNIINNLKKKQIQATLNSQEYKSAIEFLAKSIKSKCDDESLTEATIASIFELNIFSFLADVFDKKDLFPLKEVAINTERRVAKGRIDSKIGAVVIEFKKPAILKNSKSQGEATNQIVDYLKSLYAQKQGLFVGVVTDGVRCQIINYNNPSPSLPAFENLNGKAIDIIIKSILLLEETALSADNLIKDFCLPRDNSIVTNFTRRLYSELMNRITPKTAMLFTEWKEIFRLAHDDISKQTAILERRTALENVVGESLSANESEYKALYALQTAYAVIVKAIAYKVISKKFFNTSFFEFAKLANISPSTLRMQMERLEDGDIFRAYGFSNLLEGDFFSWYTSEAQWSNEIAASVKEIFVVLSKYENNDVLDKYSKVQDIFKDLFTEVMPAKVRHCLGEYYTPAWLADHVISSTIEMLDKKTAWRGLDPCAGSGTFVTVMIRHVINEFPQDSDDDLILESVLCRVKAIDLNPLAVLSARINYFINIAPYLRPNKGVEIPVYLGDASYVPEKVDIDGVECLRYSIKTQQGNIDIEIPQDAVKDTTRFSKEMTLLETDIHAKDESAVFNRLFALIPEEQQTAVIKQKIEELSSRFVEFERKDWNGIWARIVTNFLTTAHIGKFDIIVGNPPWIDWKNLPTGYRSKIVSLCLSRELFSGDGITGGINLNICALVSNVAAQNWLTNNGILAFLMPHTILFQQTYNGFRRLIQDNNKRLYFQKIVDWQKAGHPFAPVQQKFLTYYIGAKQQDYSKGISIELIEKKKGKNLSDYVHESDFDNIQDIFNTKEGILIQPSSYSTAFSYIDNPQEISAFQSIAGTSEYIGREGIEFYPQEIFLLQQNPALPPTPEAIGFTNFQNKKSKYKIPQQNSLLETTYLHPLIKGRNVSRFHVDSSGFVVPFPYDTNHKRTPIPFAFLRTQSPKLAEYLKRFESIICNQTAYNSKIIGQKYDTEFYALARVGEYSFANNFVVFRDNTKWCAAVVSKRTTPWGEHKMPVFQNHAVSISQDVNGNYISLDEAHYICAILNAPIVAKYIINSSDSRTFKVRPPVQIPKFCASNPIHLKLAKLSMRAHKNYDNSQVMATIDSELNSLYINLVKG